MAEAFYCPWIGCGHKDQLREEEYCPKCGCRAQKLGGSALATLLYEKSLSTGATETMKEGPKEIQVARMGRGELAIMGVICSSFLLGIYFYSQMPEMMASHWNMRGEVDGYLPRFWGLFLMPLIIAGLALFFAAIPRADPLEKSFQQFRKYYNGLVILVLVFMIAIYLQVILWNLGVEISPNAVLPIGFGFMFYYLGIVSEKLKRNWIIGMRTPWTLSSNKVWEKTSMFGGKLFRIAGIVTLLGAFYPSYALLFILVPLLFVVASAVAYSYLEYRKKPKDLMDNLCNPST